MTMIRRHCWEPLIADKRHYLISHDGVASATGGQAGTNSTEFSGDPSPSLSDDIAAVNPLRAGALSSSRYPPPITNTALSDARLLLCFVLIN